MKITATTVNPQISRRIMREQITIKNQGKKAKIMYFSPANSNDKKRIGQELSITVGPVKMVLKGNQIRSLRSVLERAEEEAIFAEV